MTILGPGGPTQGRQREAELSVEVVVRGATATVTVAGELDVSAIGRFRSLAGAVLDLPDIRHLSVDGEALSFVDSCGLRALLMSRSDALLAGVTWQLVAASASLRRLLDLSGIGLAVAGDSPGTPAES